MMRADCYFATGKTHAVCEDYARVGVIEEGSTAGLPYALIADGCSSSPDTDIGARLLVLAAEYAIQAWNPQSVEAWRIIQGAHGMWTSVGPPNRACLDATLLTMTCPDQDTLKATLYGDGLVAGRDHEGALWIIHIEYPSGAPDYLSYQLDPQRSGNYLKQFGNLRKMRVYRDGVWKENPETAGPFSIECYKDSFETVMLFSDGVLTFQEFDEEGLFPTPVPVEKVIEEIFAIKNWNGPFLTRRVRKFLTEYCRKHRWHHNDDFSVAAITRMEQQD